VIYHVRSTEDEGIIDQDSGQRNILHKVKYVLYEEGGKPPPLV